MLSLPETCPRHRCVQFSLCHLYVVYNNQLKLGHLFSKDDCLDSLGDDEGHRDEGRVLQHNAGESHHVNSGGTEQAQCCLL